MISEVGTSSCVLTGLGHIGDQCWTFLPKYTELPIWIFTGPGLQAASPCPFLSSPLSPVQRDESPRCVQVSAKATSVTGVQLLPSTLPFLLVLKEGTGTEHEGPSQKFLHSLLCVGTSVMCVHQNGSALTQIQDLCNHSR